MKAIGRVIFAAASICTLVEAGWFGGKKDDEEVNPERRGRWGGKPSEDTVEPEPNDYASERRERASSGGSGGERRSKRPKTAKSRDEMMSKEYNDQILNDDKIADTVTPDQNDDGYLTDDDINKIWAEHMHDFVPEDMMNAIVEHRTTEALFEEINHQTPKTVKGAYYVLNGNKEKTVDCMVYDPNRELLYKRKGSAQGILIFDTTVPGEYAIIFSNQKSGVDLTVTLALHTYEEKKEEIQFDITDDGQRYEVKQPSEDELEGLSDEERAKVLGEDSLAATDTEVAGVKRSLREIQTQVKQIQSETKLSMMRQNGHNEDVLENYDQNFYFMLVEVVAFGAIVAFQTHHIKGLLDNKLII